MKMIIHRLLVAVSLLVMTSLAQAANFSSHYPAGVEGIKGGSLPPPGVYLRDYNLFYFADSFPDSGVTDFDAFAYVQAPRLIWITDLKILGGYYGMDVLVPFYYADVEGTTPGGRFKDDTFALGDIFVEPITVSWHWKQADLGVGYGFWAPSGDYNEDGTQPARLLTQGFWTHMVTLGGTWFPDQEKTWAMSLLNRYEINMQHPDKDLTVGNTYTLEWGLSKTLRKTIDVGVIGYYQTQVTSDTGSAARGFKDHVVGVGPEISMFCPKLGLFTSVRYAYEFAAAHRPEGNTVAITLTKRF